MLGLLPKTSSRDSSFKSRGFGGSKKNSYNVPNNLFPVCRPCHTLAHSNRQVNEEFKKELQQKIDDKEFEQNGD